MSIDTSWSAASLQRPVHHHMAQLDHHVKRVTNEINNQLAKQVLAKTPVATPFSPRHPGPIIPKPIIPQNPVEQQVLAGAAKNPQAGGLVTDLRGLNKPTPGTNVINPIPSATPPGLAPGIATAVPNITPPADGIPQMGQVSGWMSPGKNFSYGQI